MWKLKVACSQLALYELSKNLWAQVRAMSSDCDSEFVLSNTLHSTSNIISIVFVGTRALCVEFEPTVSSARFDVQLNVAIPHKLLH